MTGTNDGPPQTRPAGLPRRVGALAYDLLLLAGVLFMFTLAVFVLRGGRSVPPGTLWFQLCLGALIALFFTGFWAHGGQTLGMRAWRLRVVTRAGAPLGWGRALARFGAGLLVAAPAGLGLWWAGLSAERLAWHDRLSGTRLVHELRPNRSETAAGPGARARPGPAGGAGTAASAHARNGNGGHE